MPVLILIIQLYGAIYAPVKNTINERNPITEDLFSLGCGN